MASKSFSQTSMRKALILAVALIAVACSGDGRDGGSVTAPSVAAIVTATPAVTVEPVTGAATPTLPAGIEIRGPINACITADPSQSFALYVITGAQALNVRAVSFYDPEPDCRSTTTDLHSLPVYREGDPAGSILRIPGDGALPCGSYQADIYIGDQLIWAKVVAPSGKHCAVVPPVVVDPPVVVPPVVVSALTCGPSQQTVLVGNPADLRAYGGDPTRYVWTSLDATPVKSYDATYAPRWSAPGTRLITISSGAAVATCTVVVEALPVPPPPPPAPPVCANNGSAPCVPTTPPCSSNGDVIANPYPCGVSGS